MNLPVVETVAVTGIVKVTDVALVLVTVAVTVPTSTVAPDRLVPATVTVAVPRFVPVCVNDVIVGAFGIREMDFVADPPTDVMTTEAVPKLNPLGTVNFNDVAVPPLATVAAVPATVTDALSRFVPATVTTAPKRALVGVNDVIVGAPINVIGVVALPLLVVTVTVLAPNPAIPGTVNDKLVSVAPAETTAAIVPTTTVAPARLVPVMSTTLLRPVVEGVIDEIVGGSGRTVRDRVIETPPTVTTTETDPTCTLVGTTNEKPVAVALVSDKAVPLIVAVAEVRLVPTNATVAPRIALVGVNDVTVGVATTVMDPALAEPPAVLIVTWFAPSTAVAGTV